MSNHDSESRYRPRHLLDVVAAVPLSPLRARHQPTALTPTGLVFSFITAEIENNRPMSTLCTRKSDYA